MIGRGAGSGRLIASECSGAGMDGERKVLIGSAGQGGFCVNMG